MLTKKQAIAILCATALFLASDIVYATLPEPT